MSTSAVRADQFLRSLALSVARNRVGANRPIAEVLTAEGVTEQEFIVLADNPQFKRYVEAYTADLKENGFSFSAKSKVLAEDLLPVAYHMARDEETPAAVRAKIIENLVEWADLKPKKTVDTAQGNNGYSITINIPGGVPQQIESHRAEVIEEAPTIMLPSRPPKAPITLDDDIDPDYPDADADEGFTQ